MEFNKEKIMSRVDPALLSLSGVKSVKKINEINITHNHYQLAAEYYETDLWAKHFKKCNGESPYDWIELRDQLFEVNNRILTSEYDNINSEDLFRILEILVHHSCVRHHTSTFDEGNLFRFSANQWNVLDRTLDYLEKSIELCNKINLYKDDPETGGVDGGKAWNRELMHSIWACVYGGLYEEGIYLIETMEYLIFKIHDASNFPKNRVFKTVLDQPTPGRFLKTLRMAKARLYLVKGNKVKAEETFESIVNLGKFTNNGIYRVYWSNGLNRITEAAIEVYKLNPTEKNKERCLKYYHMSTNTDIEPTESVRERGLITYMFMRDVLKINIK